MNSLRYFLGIATVVAIPVGMVYWLVIHPWARWWRRMGAIRTYFVVLPVLAVVGFLVFRVRVQLLGQDFGTNWSLIASSLILFCPVIWLESQYWNKLSIATLVGIPEVSRKRNGTLLRDGIYGVVRHPRYLSAGISVAINALIVNHLGLYVLIIAILPPGYVLLLFEERELVWRFGDDYREYQRNVPQLIPRLRKRA